MTVAWNGWPTAYRSTNQSQLACSLRVKLAPILPRNFPLQDPPPPSVSPRPGLGAAWTYPANHLATPLTRWRPGNSILGGPFPYPQRQSIYLLPATRVRAPDRSSSAVKVFHGCEILPTRHLAEVRPLRFREADRDGRRNNPTGEGKGRLVRAMKCHQR